MADKAQNTEKKTPDAKAPDALVTNDDLLALHISQGDIIAKQAEQIAAQDTKIAALTAVIKGLQSTAPVAVPVAKTAVQPEVTIGGKKYRVVHGVTVRHEQALKTLTATEVAADTALLKSLLESKSSALEAL